MRKGQDLGRREDPDPEFLPQFAAQRNTDTLARATLPPGELPHSAEMSASSAATDQDPPQRIPKQTHRNLDLRTGSRR
jgi:hypothetical protein